ncbi:MAG: hypothetical protein ACOX78_06015 [Lachnospiraceae bacterium]|jgi:hypothetical protein
MERLTNISQSKLRVPRKIIFIVKPRGRTGHKFSGTVLALQGSPGQPAPKQRYKRSSHIKRFHSKNYKGSLTQVRIYIEQGRS